MVSKDFVDRSEPKVYKRNMATKTIKLNPKSYYKAIYSANGNYANETKFDITAGLEWLGNYEFQIKDLNKWKTAKEKFEIVIDKGE